MAPRNANPKKRNSRKKKQVVPQNVVRTDFWSARNLPANPPRVPFVGPLRKRVSFNIVPASGSWTNVMSSHCYVAHFGTKAFTRMKIDNISFWTDTILPNAYMWIQVRGRAPPSLADTSSNQIFADTAKAVESRASAGYKVPDCLSGPFGASDPIAQIHTNATNVVAIVSATFY